MPAPPAVTPLVPPGANGGDGDPAAPPRDGGGGGGPGRTISSLRDWWAVAPECRDSLRVKHCPEAFVGGFRATRGFDDPATEELTIQLMLSAERKPGRFDFGPGREERTIRGGLLAVIPPGTPARFDYEGEFSVVCLAVPWGRVRRDVALTAGREVRDFGRWHEGWCADGLIAAAVRSAWACRRDPAGRAFHVETLAAAVVQRLLRGAPAAHRGRFPRRAEPLAGRAFRRALERMHDLVAVGRKPSLTELAAGAGVSRFQFCRRFKAAAGVAPREYLARLRVEAAKRRIRAGTPLARVALDGGFCDQGHLTRAFRAATGTTPAAYRAAVADD